MKSYHDIVGDGGSGILEQVAEHRTRIADGLAHGPGVGDMKGGTVQMLYALKVLLALGRETPPNDARPA